MKLFYRLSASSRILIRTRHTESLRNFLKLPLGIPQQLTSSRGRSPPFQTAAAMHYSSSMPISSPAPQARRSSYRRRSPARVSVSSRLPANPDAGGKRTRKSGPTEAPLA
ncbi:hypothetical protein NQZ68_019219 [Dissostichus eleginoides]|nr:hypothetical protein NQZ68_019219 [Dissostichus eleginoides]